MLPMHITIKCAYLHARDRSGRKMLLTPKEQTGQAEEQYTGQTEEQNAHQSCNQGRKHSLPSVL